MADNVSLVTQMRAGTHYMCGALRFALEASVMWPKDGAYAPMADAEILNNLHPNNRFVLPPPQPGRSIYFSHYYHLQRYTLPPMPRLSLIAFPLDSFYSDGVVYNDANYSAKPADSRANAGKYVLRHGSEEWKLLEVRMYQNAKWLLEIGKDSSDVVIRYEDLSQDFDRANAQIESHLGLLRPLPKPVINPRRSYWTGNYGAKFDRKALSCLTSIFMEPIARFYPERMRSLTFSQSHAID